MNTKIRDLRRLATLKARAHYYAWRESDKFHQYDHRVIDAGNPLILISEIQRSGGTLLSQLLDGHPQVFAHPAEIELGYPMKWDWLAHIRSANDWFLFEKLCDRTLLGLAVSGKYRKDTRSQMTLPFDFSVRNYRETLLRRAKADGTPAGLFRACMTGVFTAWLNYHHRDSASLLKKRFVSGFVPRLIMFDNSLRSLFESCPDVKILTIIRDPLSWYASAKAHGRSYANVADSMSLWFASAQASANLASRRPDACKQLFFQDLVNETSATMRSIAAFVGLSWSDMLLKPTFNGCEIPSNSKFKPSRGAIDTAVTERWRGYLNGDEIAFIERFVMDRTPFGVDGRPRRIV